jgi:hypothetical protein
MAKSGKLQTKGVELLIMNYQKNSPVNVVEVEQEQSSSEDDLDFDFSI